MGSAGILGSAGMVERTRAAEVGKYMASDEIGIGENMRKYT